MTERHTCLHCTPPRTFIGIKNAKKHLQRKHQIYTIGTRETLRHYQVTT